MKKSLLNQQDADEIISRAGQLRADSPNCWGAMTVAEMLLHCTLANRFVLEDNALYQRPAFKQRILKFICLHVITKFPKNRIGSARLRTRGMIDDMDFEDQRKAYIAIVSKFPRHSRAMTSIHPGMGYLNNKEWGIIAWMHMDHHLRQFGA